MKVRARPTTGLGCSLTPRGLPTSQPKDQARLLAELKQDFRASLTGGTEVAANARNARVHNDTFCVSVRAWIHGKNMTASLAKNGIA